MEEGQLRAFGLGQPSSIPEPAEEDQEARAAQQMKGNGADGRSLRRDGEVRRFAAPSTRRHRGPVLKHSMKFRHGR